MLNIKCLHRIIFFLLWQGVTHQVSIHDNFLLPLSTAFSTHSELCCSPRPEKRESDHITPLFQALHWLLIKQRIRYKINTLCYRCITCTAPSNLCDRLQLSTPSRTLRSASDTLSLQTSGIRLSTVCSQDISVFGPYTWNDLPLPLRKKKKKNPLWTPANPTSKRFSFPKR